MRPLSFPAAVVLTIFCSVGVAMFCYGLHRLRSLIRFHHNSIRIIARQLPDHVSPEPPGLASFPPAIYQRQASFHCPLREEKRVATERVRSSRQSRWTEGQAIVVRVSRTPPHEALIATVNNMYLFPAVYLAFGAGFALVLPIALLGA
jgi:hypothetical protein